MKKKTNINIDIESLYPIIIEMMLMGNIQRINKAKSALKVRQYLRQIANAASYFPIKFVDGFRSPKQKGKCCNWFTYGGQVVKHMLSYYYAGGYHSMTYRHSTLRVEVGMKWFINHFKKVMK